MDNKNIDEKMNDILEKQKEQEDINEVDTTLLAIGLLLSSFLIPTFLNSSNFLDAFSSTSGVYATMTGLMGVFVSGYSAISLIISNIKLKKLINEYKEKNKEKNKESNIENTKDFELQNSNTHEKTAELSIESKKRILQETKSLITEKSAEENYSKQKKLK